MLELFDTNVPKENWCIPKFNNTFKAIDGSGRVCEIEIGLYKEEDGALTMEVFDGDDIIFCRIILE